MIYKLLEKDYFTNNQEMHYALLTSVEKIGPKPHTHNFYEIFLLINGKINHIINGHRMILIEGSMTFIRPQDVHQFNPVPDCNCHMINLAVAKRAIDDLFAYLGEGFQGHLICDLPLPPTVNLSQSIKDLVQAKLEELQSIPYYETAVRHTALRMLLFELITQYFPLTIKDRKNDMPLWLQKACDEMQKPENLIDGLPKMLDIASVSAEHLARTVKKYFKQTPTEYVNQTRLTYAANLLKHSDQTVTQIAADVGFDSLSYFYHLFKARFSQTPREFRISHQPMLVQINKNLI